MSTGPTGIIWTMFSLKTIAILVTITFGCTSAIRHPPARNGDWVTLSSTTYAPPSRGRRFKIYAPGPEDCWIPLSNLPSLTKSPDDGGTLRIGGDTVANIAGNKVRYPHSIVLAYHGRGAHVDRMARVSRFHEFARPPNKRCSIVIYPEGLPSYDGRHAWQPAPYANPNADDIQFTKDILKWVDIKYAEHASKRDVYASGKSNGAAMVAWIACRMSDVIAAFAPVSGPLYLAADLTHPDPNCNPARPVPIIEFHGTDDRFAPYCHYRSQWLHGGSISTVMSWVQWWANKNECESEPTRSAPKAAVQEIGLLKTEIEVYHNCTGGVEVIHYRVVHGLHDWPSFVRMDDNEDDESNPSMWVPTVPGWGDWSPGTVEATEIIMEFFRRFQLP